MTALSARLLKLNMLARTVSFKLSLFLLIQILSGYIIVSHMHYMNVKDMSIVELRLQHHNTVTREWLFNLFDSIDSRVDYVLLSYDKKKDNLSFSTDEGYIFLQDLMLPSIPSIVFHAIINSEGNLLGNSYKYPSPKVNVEDRLYFIKSKRGETVTYFGPYQSRLTDTFAYATIRRISNHDSSFGGVLVSELSLPQLASFCTSNPIAEELTTYILNPQGDILFKCLNSKPYFENSGKNFYQLSENSQFRDISVSSLSTKVETPDWLLYVSKLPSHSELQVLTIAAKKGISKDMEAILWKNNLYIIIIILAEIACFMLYRNSLIVESEATYSTFMDES